MNQPFNMVTAQKYPTGRELYIGQLCEPSQASNSDTFTKKDFKGSLYYTIFHQLYTNPMGGVYLWSVHAMALMIVLYFSNCTPPLVGVYLRSVQAMALMIMTIFPPKEDACG